MVKFFFISLFVKILALDSTVIRNGMDGYFLKIAYSPFWRGMSLNFHLQLLQSILKIIIYYKISKIYIIELLFT